MQQQYPMAPYPHYGPPPPPPPPRKSRAGLFIGLAFLALVLVAGSAGAVVYLKRTTTPGSSVANSTKDSAAPNPDEVLMTQVPGEGPAPKFGGTPIYDGCSLITIKDLKQIGVELNYDVTVMHDYLDGDVPPEAAASQTSLDSATHCYYSLANRNWLQVEVHQTPYNTAKDIEFRSGKPERKGAKVRTDSGLSIAHMDAGDQWEIYLWKADMLIVVAFQTEKPGSYGPFDKKAFAEQLEPIAKAAILKGPTAPVRHVYAAPFDKVKHPCEVASVEAFKKSYPSSASAAAVKTQFHPKASLTSLEYHKSESSLQGGMLCTRHNIVKDGVTNDAEYRALDLKLNAWVNPQGAIDLNAYFCDPNAAHPVGVPIAVQPVVGTGQTCMTDLQINWSMDILVENVSITLVAARGRSKMTAEERRDQLLPAAQVIAAAGVSK